MDFTPRPLLFALFYTIATNVCFCSCVFSQEEISKQEIQSWANDFELAAVEGDRDKMNTLISWELLVNDAMQSLTFGKDKNDTIKAGVIKGLTSPGSYSDVLAETVSSGGSTKLIRFHKKEGKQFALFRTLSDLGINYQDYQLTKKDNQVVAEDVYIFITGDKLSQTLRVNLLPISKQLSKNWFQKISSSDKQFIENFDAWKLFLEQSENGDYDNGMATYERLPDSMKKQKIVLIGLYTLCSQAEQDEQLVEIVDDFNRIYPNDAAIDLLSIDALIVQEKYNDAIKAVNRLDKAVGTDPYLDDLRASILLMHGKTKEAFETSKKCIQSLPDLLDPHWTYISIVLEMKDFSKVYNGLNHIEKNFEMEFEDLRTLDIYSDFCRSPEGKKWLWEHGFE